ncbi:MAG TPA: 23S rRNA (pseudouridine(1915)-N(3))-methyltransferase RlmH [Nitrospirae bacterium]|nr:23S rRNA (pseudouridine(1915)-N(3))-methyltransferase RlmH [Nitrospirota bacterium]
MKIKLLWLGKTKETFIEQGIKHYIKLIKPIININIEEIKEIRGKSIEETLLYEGKKVLEKTKDYFLLDQSGKEYSSEDFAIFISNSLKDERLLTFLFGGPFGVSREIKEKAKSIISLSRMTFTHEVSRLLFLEQLYRAFTIIKGKVYHY